MASGHTTCAVPPATLKDWARSGCLCSRTPRKGSTALAGLGLSIATAVTDRRVVVSLDAAYPNPWRSNPSRAWSSVARSRLWMTGGAALTERQGTQQSLTSGGRGIRTHETGGDPPNGFQDRWLYRS